MQPTVASLMATIPADCGWPSMARHLSEIFTRLQIGEDNVASARSAYNNPQSALGQEICVGPYVVLMEQPFLGLNSTPLTTEIKRCDLCGIEGKQKCASHQEICASSSDAPTGDRNPSLSSIQRHISERCSALSHGSPTAAHHDRAAHHVFHLERMRQLCPLLTWNTWTVHDMAGSRRLPPRMRRA
jgi:hypothetical protein